MYTFFANSSILDLLSKIVSIFEGKSKISDFKASISDSSHLPSISAKYIASIAIKTTWAVYAFVDATAISGPACVYIE